METGETGSKIIANLEVTLAKDAMSLAVASVELMQSLTVEERIEAHQHALELMHDLQEAGRLARAAESQSAT